MYQFTHGTALQAEYSVRLCVMVLPSRQQMLCEAVCDGTAILAECSVRQRVMVLSFQAECSVRLRVIVLPSRQSAL
ncbi:MAG: hypothetical protein MSK32_04020 [Paraprevotella sp.]|nr:hypothetical protein [Paraprevotella sp.]